MSAADIAALRAHVQARLDTAAIEPFPFPHAVIPGIFPDDVYAEILARNPFGRAKERPWVPKSEGTTADDQKPYHLRTQVDLARVEEAIADDGARAFWQSIRDALLGEQWWVRAVLAKFPAFFQLRFGPLIEDADFPALLETQLFAQRHAGGFRIGPHTDLPTRVFTCIFSFAAEEGHDAAGTVLYEPEDRLVRCWGNDHHREEGFRQVKVAPYRPNHLLLFFKTRQSFHGVDRVPDDLPGGRYGMQVQVYEPQGGLFRDLSAPDLMAARHVGLKQRGLRASLRRRLRRILGSTD